MNKEKAAKHLRSMMLAVQRLRSILDEDGLITDREQANALSMTTDAASRAWPWVWGKKCIIPALSKVLDRYDETGELPYLDFYNLIYIATRLEPLIAAVSFANGDRDFPEEASIEWLRGWDS